MNIQVVWDPSVNNAPAGFVSAINYVVNLFNQLITDPGVVKINVGWGVVQGAPVDNNALGQGYPTYIGGGAVSYEQWLVAAKAHATTPDTIAALASLPAVNPTSGYLNLSLAQARVLGLWNNPVSLADGYVGFSTNVNWAFDPNNRAVPGAFDFIATAEHEIARALGRSYTLSSTYGYMSMDLFRWSAPGVRALTPQNAYFSVDGGVTNLRNFTPTGDLVDWLPSGTHDAFDYASATGAYFGLSAVDVMVFNALGYNTATVINNTWNYAPYFFQQGALALYGTATSLLAPITKVSLFEGSIKLADATLDVATGVWSFAAIYTADIHLGLKAIAYDKGGITGTFNTGVDMFVLAQGQTQTIATAIYDEAAQGGPTPTLLELSGPGTGKLAVANFYTGGTRIDFGATLELAVAGAAGTGAITFVGAAAKLKIGAGATPTNIIKGFALGNVIDFTSVVAASASLGANNVLSVNNAAGAVVATLNFSATANFSGMPFAVSSDGYGGTNLRIAQTTFTIASAAAFATDLASLSIGGINSAANAVYTINFSNGFDPGSSIGAVSLLAGDTLTIHKGAGDSIFGGVGAESLNGGSGNDTLNGGEGLDTLNGAGGNDTVSYAGTTGNVFADILNSNAGTINGVLIDVYTSIENLIGGFGNDTLLGNNSANRLSGDTGDDLLFGQDGNDTLIGGAHVAGSFNQLFGGNGVDTADYSAEVGKVFVDLRAPAGHIDTGGGFVLNDLMNSIENVLGGANDDTIVGADADNNLLVGNAGTDLLFGLGGNDTLIGGGANAGQYNQLFGDTGNDTVSYLGTTFGVFADLNVFAGYVKNGAGTLILTDVYSQVENLVGGSLADTLVGNTGANSLNGGAGADFLYANFDANNPTLHDASIDTFVYNAGSESTLGSGFDQIVNFTSGQDLIDLRALNINAGNVTLNNNGGSWSIFADTDGIAGIGANDLAILVQSPVFTMGDILFV